jgi:hypothetical protein
MPGCSWGFVRVLVKSAQAPELANLSWSTSHTILWSIGGIVVLIRSFLIVRPLGNATRTSPKNTPNTPEATG